MMITTRDARVAEILALRRQQQKAQVCQRTYRSVAPTAPKKIIGGGITAIPGPIKIIGGGPGEHVTGFNLNGGGGLVTGITVCHNTRILTGKSYQSIRRFYPNMPIIIVDGSDPENSCTPYVQALASDLTTIMRPGYNVGHGLGMNMGINYCRTRYALMFDTDVELLEPCVGDMLAMMKEDTFGVGYVIPTAFGGFGTLYTYPPASTPKNGNWMPYLHPYFQLIDIKNYRKFPPYENQGAPCTPTMLAIYKQGLSWEIIKQFKDMSNGTAKFVRHDGGGTCRRNLKLCI